MLKEFCIKCGHPSLYSYEKPSFCAKCGHSFSGTVKGKVSAPKQGSPVKASNPIEPEEEETIVIPDISELDFHVEKFEKNAPTIGTIASLGPPAEAKKGNNQKRPQIAPTPQDQKQFLKDFEKEAGSLRR